MYRPVHGRKSGAMGQEVFATTSLDIQKTRRKSSLTHQVRTWEEAHRGLPRVKIVGGQRGGDTSPKRMSVENGSQQRQRRCLVGSYSTVQLASPVQNIYIYISTQYISVCNHI